MQSVTHLAEEKFGTISGYESSDSVLFDCPACGHTLRVSLSKGAYHCFYCGLKGWLSGNIKYQKIPFERRWGIGLKSYNFVNYAYEELLDTPDSLEFLKSREIIPNLNKKIGLKRTFGRERLSVRSLINKVSIQELRAYDIINKQSGAICGVLKPNRYIFPYLALGTKGNYKQPTPVGFKSRAIGEGVRYLYNPGSICSNYPYTLHTLDDLKGKTVYVVEGEFKALALNSKGYYAISIPGISMTWYIKTVLEYIFKVARKVFILLDTDGGKWANYNVLRAAKALLEIDPNKTCPMWLPQVDVLTKVDTNDFFKTYCNDDFDDLSYHYEFNCEKEKGKIFKAIRDLEEELKEF